MRSLCGAFLCLTEDAKRDPSYVIAFRGTLHRTHCAFFAPSPAEHERMILSALVDVLAVLDQGVTNRLLGVGSARAELRQAVNDILYQVEPVQFVQHHHVEGCCGSAFLFVATDM